jgi:hypothetical protein
VDIGAYRDALGHDLKDNMAFLKAQTIADESGVAREQLCKTLDDCDVGADLADAARRIFEMRWAKPGDTPVDYRAWQTGPRGEIRRRPVRGDRPRGCAAAAP